MFLSRINYIKVRIHESGKGDKISYWLEPKDYEYLKDNWGIIGNGYD